MTAIAKTAALSTAILVMALSITALAQKTTAVTAPVAPPSAASHATTEFHPLPGLTTSGQPAADAWTAIAARGTTTVIDLRPASELPGRDEAAEVAGAGMTYLRIPVEGAAGLTPENADALWAALEGAPGKTLLHCASGNRAGALLAIATARNGGLSAEGAIALGRAAGMTSTEPRVREVLGVTTVSDDAASLPASH